MVTNLSHVTNTVLLTDVTYTRLFCSGHLWQIQDVVKNLAHRFHLPSNSPPILLSLFISGMEGERWEERLDGDRDSITLAWRRPREGGGRGGGAAIPHVCL